MLRTYRWEGTTSISTAVVEAVADASGRDPAEVQPLYTVVDPDVLDALFEYGQEPGWEGSLTFTLDRYRVTVEDTGTITVTCPGSDAVAEVEGAARSGSGRAADRFPAEQ